MIPYVQLRRAHLAAICVILALNAMDIGTTLYALQIGAIEANPLSAFLMGWHVLWPVKILLPLVIAFRFWRSETEIDKLSAAWMTVGIYSLVITLNVITVIHYIRA